MSNTKTFLLFLSVLLVFFFQGAQSGYAAILNVTSSNDTISDDGACTLCEAITNTKSTFYINSSAAYGGAIMNVVGTLTLINSTLAENSTDTSGSALQNEGTLHLANSILADNSAPLNYRPSPGQCFCRR